MKQATCKELRGACDTIITGNTPEEMVENCKQHAMDQMSDGDTAHIAAGKSMMALSKEEQIRLYKEFEANFESFKDAQ